MGGGKKRGEENLTNDTPPKQGFWTSPRTALSPLIKGVDLILNDEGAGCGSFFK